MSQTRSATAAQLLELHVQHELAALQGERLQGFVEDEIDALFGLSEKITLTDVVSARQMTAVIRHQLVEKDVRGGIAKLVGELAAAVVNAPVQSSTTFGDLIERDRASAFIEAFLALSDQREMLISAVVANPVFQDMVLTVVYHAIISYVYEDNFLSRNVPGVGSVMKLGRQAANRAVPGIDEAFERQLKAFLNKNLPALLNRSESFLHRALSDDELRDTLMAAWQGIEDRPLADLQRGLAELESHEFGALGYEFWLDLRQTDYFEGCYRAVVDHLFVRYGEVPLIDLLADMGVTRDSVRREIPSIVASTLDLLRREGYLEVLVRRRLTLFYESDAVTELLS